MRRVSDATPCSLQPAPSQLAACTIATYSLHLHFYRYAKLEAVQHAKEEEAIADLVKAAISKGEIKTITAGEFDLLRSAASSS